MFLGDSITEGWKRFDPDFFDHGLVDRGISGQMTAQMLVRLRADGQGGIKATLSEDGVHPNAAGYAAIRPVAQAAVRQALSRRVRLQ